MDRLDYFLGTNQPVELWCNSSVSNNLFQNVDCPTWIPNCDCCGPFLDIFLCSNSSIVLQWLSKHKGKVIFHCTAFNYSCADGNGPCDCLRDTSWEDVLKFQTSAAATAFCG